ncbi:TPA: P-loop NTPase fold protein [Serratia fonticola]
MELLKSRTASAIIRLLNKKRDGLILLNGDWGSGKTYFIERFFPSLYDSKPIFIISLLGVRDLSDFKSKIINTCYLENTDDLKRVVEVTSQTLSVSAGASESAGVINSIIQSISSGVKERVLSNLSGLFVIDDIERIESESALSEILTYCHSLYTGSKNNEIDIILLGNFKSQEEIKIKHQEKIVSDYLPFSPSIDDLEEMLRPTLEFMNGNHINKLFSTIGNLELTNIRVIKKIIDKIKPIVVMSNSQTNNDSIISMGNIISIIVSATIAKDIYNKKIKELEKYNSLMSNDNDGTDEKLKRVMSAATAYQSGRLIPYIFNEESATDVLNHLFYPKIKLSPREIALSNEPQYQNISEDNLLDEFILIIKKENATLLSDWIKAVSNYKFLSEREYIHTSPKLQDSIINDISMTFSEQELIEHFEQNKKYSDTPDIILRSRITLPIENELYKKYTLLKKDKIINGIIDDIVSHGWAAFDVSRIENIGDLTKFKPLEIIGASTIIRCIWRGSWTSIDIESFTYYIKKLYNFQNINDYLLGERDSLRKVILKLELYLGIKSKSFKYGAIKELNKTMKDCLSRLEV